MDSDMRYPEEVRADAIERCMRSHGRTGRAMINYARIENSERLQRVHALLCDGAWHGTRAIMHGADVCAVNTVVAELRANGYDIETRCVGRGRYEYRLLSD